MINAILQFLGLDLFNIKLSAKFYQNIPNGLIVNFHFFFRIWTSAKPRPIPNVIWRSPGLHLVNIPMCMQNFITIFHSVQEIRPFSLFQKLALGKASTDDKCHFATVSLFSEFEPPQKLNQSQMLFDILMGYILSISMCIQNFITIFHSVHHFFRIWSPAKPRPMKNVISQSLGLDLVNINVYENV